MNARPRDARNTPLDALLDGRPDSAFEGRGVSARALRRARRGKGLRQDAARRLADMLGVSLELVTSAVEATAEWHRGTP